MNSEKGKSQQNNNNNQTEKKIEEKNKYKILYSQYGYIKIFEKDINNNSLTLYNFIQYKNNDKNNNSLKGFIYKNNIKDNINIKLKSFSGSRNIILVEKTNINLKINILLECITDPNNNTKKYTKNSQIRLYSCQKGLKELNTNSTFFENNLQDNELVLFFKEIPLSLSKDMKGKSIELSQGYRTAFKANTDDPQYVLGNVGYSSGRHYFEIKLLTDPMIRSVVVGLSTKKNEKNLFILDIHNFYGFILSDMKKTVLNFDDNSENLIDYGEVCNINDKIGILYDWKNDGVNISFYRNKKFLGIAFEKLPNNIIYFPTIEMGLCGSKIQIYNEIDFPDS